MMDTLGVFNYYAEVLSCHVRDNDLLLLIAFTAELVTLMGCTDRDRLVRRKIVQDLRIFTADLLNEEPDLRNARGTTNHNHFFKLVPVDLVVNENFFKRLFAFLPDIFAEMLEGRTIELNFQLRFIIILEWHIHISGLIKRVKSSL